MSSWNGLFTGTVLPFVASKTYAALEYAKSTLDFEVYQRRTAGQTSTDPADDTTNWIAISYARTLALLRTPQTMLLVNSSSGFTTITPGVHVANTYLNLLTVSGRGVVNALILGSGSSVNTAMRLIIDGRTLIDNSASKVSASSGGGSAVYLGSPVSGDTSTTTSITGQVAYQPIEFKRTLVIDGMCATSGTGLFNLGYNYELRA